MKIEELFSHGESGESVASVLERAPVTTKGQIARTLKVPQPAINSVVNTMAEQGKAVITKAQVLSITADNRKRQCVIAVCKDNVELLTQLSENWDTSIQYGNKAKVMAFIKANKPAASKKP
jgi:hypothetical protein